MLVYTVVGTECEYDGYCDVVAVFTDKETARIYADKAGGYDIDEVELDPPVTQEWLSRLTWWDALVRDDSTVEWYRPASIPIKGADFAVRENWGIGSLVTFQAGHPDTVEERAIEIYRDWKKTMEADK